MPILPENKKRYPKNWKQIRLQILKRAKHKCEKCGVRNRVFGVRDQWGNFYEMQGMQLETASLDGEKVIEIVLKIAHLNHQPEDNDETNLAALCQKCHLNHDKDQHRKTRSHTKYKKLEKQGQEKLI